MQYKNTKLSKELIHKYNEIEVVKKRFLKKVENISYEQLNRLPLNNGWSAGQVLYHCGIAESGTILTINKNLNDHKVQFNSGWKNLFQNIVLVLFLKLPIKFKAPKIVSSVPEVITYQELKKSFDANTQDFKKILQDLPSELEYKLIFKHPISGLFNIHQTLRFLLEHYLHHERQLDALL